MMNILNYEKIENLDLKSYTTLKVGGEAKLAYFPNTEQEFINIVNNNKDVEIIGAGSNLLITSHGIDKCIITKNLKEIKRLKFQKINKRK